MHFGHCEPHLSQTQKKVFFSFQGLKSRPPQVVWNLNHLLLCSKLPLPTAVSYGVMNLEEC